MYEIYCKLRNAKGYKDADVARGTGITKSTFSDWKNGRSSPKQDKLQKIADFFGVSIDYLRTGEQKEKQPSDTPSAINDDILKAAFYGDYSDKLSPKEVDELWEDAKEYAQFKAQQRINKKD